MNGIAEEMLSGDEGMYDHTTLASVAAVADLTTPG